MNEIIENFLLSSQNLDKMHGEQFIKEHSEHENRFELPIKKNIVLKFVDAIEKKIYQFKTYKSSKAAWFVWNLPTLSREKD